MSQQKPKLNALTEKNVLEKHFSSILNVNICWFFFVVYDGKLNIFEFWTVCWTKDDIFTVKYNYNKSEDQLKEELILKQVL